MVDIILGSSDRFVLSHRLFNVITFCGIIIAGLMFGSDVSLGLGPKYYCFSLIVTIAFMLLYLGGRKKFNFKKLIWPLIIIGYFAVFYVWGMLGGITGTSLIIALSLLIPISILLSGTQKYLALAGILIIVTGVSMAEIMDPQIVYLHDSSSKHLMDFFISTVFIGTGIVLCISLVMRSFHDQHEEITSLNQALENSNRLLKSRNEELERALSEIRTLKAILPICSSCKRIRDNKGHWSHMESYFRKKLDAQFSHGVCPECLKELYPDFESTDD